MKTLRILLVLSLLSLGVFFLSNIALDYKTIKNATEQSIVKVRVLRPEGSVQGTGFIFNYKNKNYVMTNYHVCYKAKDNQVLLETKEYRMLKNIILGNVNLDLCIIEGIEGEPYLTLEDNPKEDDTVYTVGHPWGEPIVISKGNVISFKTIKTPFFEPVGEEECLSMGYGFEYQTFETDFFDFGLCLINFNVIQTTNKVYPGNSGSPLLNENLKVVGLVNSANVGQGFGYSIPIKSILSFLENNLKE